MLACMLAAVFAAAEPAVVTEWDFADETVLQEWEPNPHFDEAEVTADGVRALAAGHDPFFLNRDVHFEARPGQYVVARFKADAPGQGQLFWSESLEGPYGGLEPGKNETFRVQGAGEWEEAVILPFWHAEGTIRQLRFDVFQGVEVTLGSIQVLERPIEPLAPDADPVWRPGDDLAEFALHPASDVYLAPWAGFSADGRGWAVVELSAEEDGVAEIIWNAGGHQGMQREVFRYEAGDDQVYNVELQGRPEWAGAVDAFGLRLPGDPQGLRVNSVAVEEKPGGSADIHVRYFGFEDGVNRAGREVSVLAYLTNRGGETAEDVRLQLQTPDGVELAADDAEQSIEQLPFNEHVAVTWDVTAEEPGAHPVTLRRGDGASLAEAELAFSADPGLAEADYVPAPEPVETELDVLAYYFPGWDSDAKWDPIRRVSPERKPVLGYYDEGNPECVDWQIKWAVENGIDTFLVCWYWITGDRILEHWLEAYQEAEYRDHLRIALMWANHNPPDTHSHEDWLDVTQHWIDEYFHWDTYYRIDGKPAVFIFDPRNIEADLGGPEAVAEAMAESQELAQEAGYEGITFVALGGGASLDHPMPFGQATEELAQRRHKEGYAAATSYHEWGEAPERAPTPQQMQFEDVVETSRETWERIREGVKPLDYYPVAATGWDAQPWHGPSARTIHGRTPALFEQQLRELHGYAEDHGLERVVISPLNEWGEGSYIEPCTEFGFEMYEAIREVFGKGDPEDWPLNIAPADVGLGPYDFETPPVRTEWTFEEDAGGWRIMQHGTDLRVEDGAMRLRTTGDDPALVVDTPGLHAGEFDAVEVEMAVQSAEETDMGQLFWSMEGATISEATSQRFSVEPDGEFHTYRLNLSENPRWRGQISALRFDPSIRKGAEVIVRSIRFR